MLDSQKHNYTILYIYKNIYIVDDGNS